MEGPKKHENKVDGLDKVWESGILDEMRQNSGKGRRRGKGVWQKRGRRQERRERRRKLKEG